MNPEKKITLSQVFSKYIKRMVLALTVFTLLFQIIDALLGEIDSSPDNLFLGWISNLILGESWAHLWYLYLMIGLYLMLPIYKVFTKYCTNKELKYLIIVIALFISIISMTEVFGFVTSFYIPTSIIYPIYFFLGFAIWSGRISLNKKISISLIVVSTILIVIFTTIRYNVLNGIIEDTRMDGLFGYKSIFVVCQSIGIFGFFKNIDAKKWMKSSFIRSIDACTFGIYLIHMIFIRVVFKHLQFNPYVMGGPFAFIGLTMVFFFISYAIAWILRKLPFDFI